MVGGSEVRTDDIEIIGATPEDQDFIAHARQDIILLLEEIDYLKSQLRLTLDGG